MSRGSSAAGELQEWWIHRDSSLAFSREARHRHPELARSFVNGLRQTSCLMGGGIAVVNRRRDGRRVMADASAHGRFMSVARLNRAAAWHPGSGGGAVSIVARHPAHKNGIMGHRSDCNIFRCSWYVLMRRISQGNCEGRNL